MHILSEAIENTVLDQEFIKCHEIISSFTAFGGLSIENDDFFEVLLWKQLIFELEESQISLDKLAGIDSDFL